MATKVNVLLLLMSWQSLTLDTLQVLQLATKLNVLLMLMTFSLTFKKAIHLRYPVYEPRKLCKLQRLGLGCFPLITFKIFYLVQNTCQTLKNVIKNVYSIMEKRLL